jgi:hypothetical protein
MIGRVAFPLFAWLIANGSYHTKNINLYLRRLFIFAVISQVPFYFANRLIDPAFNVLNVLFTLSLGLLAIKLIKISNSKFYRSLIIITAAVTGHFINLEFGAIGVLSIIYFYIYFKDKKRLILSQTAIYLIQPIYSITESAAISASDALLQYIYYTPIILLTLVIILNYNKKRGRKMKYVFYLFYPLQFVVFYLLKSVLKST